MRDWPLEAFMSQQRKRVRQRCEAIDKRIEQRRQDQLSVTLQLMENEQQVAAMCHVSGRRRPNMDGD